MTADPRQVPTLPVLCDIELETGRTAQVTLFLSITSASHDGAETLDEFLNAPRRFFPVAQPERSDRDLLARDAVVSVRVSSDIAPSAVEQTQEDVELVRVELSSGNTVDGVVLHAHEARMSDFFNAGPDFFALQDGAGVLYVNKRHVIAITL
jgi:hypothetical protein